MSLVNGHPDRVFMHIEGAFCARFGHERYMTVSGVHFTGTEFGNNRAVALDDDVVMRVLVDLPYDEGICRQKYLPQIHPRRERVLQWTVTRLVLLQMAFEAKNRIPGWAELFYEIDGKWRDGVHEGTNVMSGVTA